MKIVVVTLGKPGQRAEREGWVIINYAAPEGGVTNIGALIKRPQWEEVTEQGRIHRQGPLPMWEEVAFTLDNNMGGRPWPRAIQHKVSGNTLRLACPDEMNSVVFFAEFNPTLNQSAAHELHPDFVTIADENF